MNNFIAKHRAFWTNREILLHMALSVFLLCVSIVLVTVARVYTNDYTGNVVPDILLDNIPVYDVGYIFFQGAFLFILALIGIVLCVPQYAPFVLESSAVFFLIRAFFMIMTHLSAPSIEYYHYIEHEHHVRQVLFTLSSGNDLFFSGHTGYPFLLALVFWKRLPLRYFFLVCSLIGGTAVILGHLHYSIDVFSAFFIAYGVFEITRRFFTKEYALSNS